MEWTQCKYNLYNHVMETSCITINATFVKLKSSFVTESVFEFMLMLYLIIKVNLLLCM